MLLEVDDQGLAHILTGLRMLQRALEETGPILLDGVVQMAEITVMSLEQIDRLCEDLNCPGEEVYLAWDHDAREVVFAGGSLAEVRHAVDELDDIVIRPFLTGAPEVTDDVDEDD